MVMEIGCQHELNMSGSKQYIVLDSFPQRAAEILTPSTAVFGGHIYKLMLESSQAKITLFLCNIRLSLGGLGSSLECGPLALVLHTSAVDMC